MVAVLFIGCGTSDMVWAQRIWIGGMVNYTDYCLVEQLAMYFKQVAPHNDGSKPS